MMFSQYILGVGLMVIIIFTIVQVYSAINSIIRAANALERIAAALEDEEDEENEEDGV